MSSDSDQALDELRRRLTDPTADEERRARYWAAIRRDTTSRSKVDAVLRLVDAELAALGGSAAAFDERLADLQAEVRRQQVVQDRLLAQAKGERDDFGKAVERALDLAEVWETVEPHTLMSRRRAAAILREVVQP